MSTPVPRNRARKPLDLSVFVDHVRAVNQEAARIIQAPLGVDQGAALHCRQELADVLQELEHTVRALRVATVGAPSAARRAAVSPASPQGAEAPWLLDTPEAMIARQQLLAPLAFQHLMGWASRQAVWKAADGHRIFYLTHKAERYFPAFYGDARYDRKQLEAVTKVLGDLPGGAKLQFFLTPKGSLGGDTPLQALAAGRAAKVKDVAAAFAEVATEA